MARSTKISDEPDIADFDFPRILAAVADPVRLSILKQLANAEEALSCGAIELPIKASTATHHFTALRQAGVLHQYYVGTSRMNLLRIDDMERAYPGFLPSVIAGLATTTPK
ncbi:ArsR/SmtB family transcription factor [Paeniglutamicibacter sulfureus]|uniref:DNA-binding transcriptional ArsR family regulator n=1 Tax=Paeniglutamicibacter sulfureus TaxID=43666 RepID=A0ABU2BF00_9MICC|nr:helix-turn-helix domain-containing protein [Paeniglutamicibacter sulfureus]MDO2932923.1 helix-turn-helix domain-containing protein [Paeniglutamicibacter sulfureus]MDR7357196.1 DNA-binding transcriptional ArsR family regulator [Paeniglutamicibacter sulfureus]